MAKKNKGSLRTVIISISLILLVIGGIGGYMAWKWVYAPNVEVEGDKPAYLYIHTGWKFEDVLKELESHKFVKDIQSFEKIAKRKRYDEKIMPGRYKLVKGMNNNDLVNMLRSGKQEEVKLVFSGVRKKEEFVHKICSQLELDSMTLLDMLNDINPDDALILFIPNTYKMKWNTSAEQFMQRMASEYNKFWTPARKGKADDAELSQSDVSILASIVQSETTKEDEKPRIAGVYINRLHKNMKLEADPTLVWALNDFSIRRLTNEDMKVNSPYNTYMHTGLPPGPITLPSISSLDAVLNYEHHKYIYFCAKEDLSGYSNFATNMKDHKANSKRYTQELNKRKIYR